MYFFVVVLFNILVFLNVQYFKMFSAIIIKWQKNENFWTDKLSADPNFGRKNFTTKKNPNVFPSESFRS